VGVGAGGIAGGGFALSAAPEASSGRKAIARIEQAMPEQFLLNMSGTRMVFTNSGG
jgi:hypothetical protein